MTVVEFVPRIRDLPPRPKGQELRRARAATAVFSVLAVLAVAVVATMLITGRIDTYLAIASPVFLVVCVLVVIEQLRLQRRLAELPDGEVRTVAPHAFTLTADTVEFPGTTSQALESWPLPSTTARERSRLGMPLLVLSHPGRKDRRYLGKVLERPVPELVRLVNDAATASSGR